MPTLPDHVILLHGLWMRGYAMQLLALRLRQAGFTTEIFQYPTLRNTPAQAAQRLQQRLGDFGPRTVHVIGHSLGGVVALLATADVDQPGRNLCLGSPLTECETARRLQRHAPVLMGNSAQTLIQGLAPWTGPRQVGVIAGNLAVGLGRLLGRLEGDNDGTVRVAETRLPGITDHRILPASHTGLPFLRGCATLSIHFLRHGQFA